MVCLNALQSSDTTSTLGHSGRSTGLWPRGCLSLRAGSGSAPHFLRSLHIHHLFRIRPTRASSLPDGNGQDTRTGSHCRHAINHPRI